MVLALAVGLWLQDRPERRPDNWIRKVLSDPEIRRKAVERLISETSGIHDSAVDPDVGRVLLPGLKGRELAGVPCDTSSLGLREREFTWEKPAGTLRIVFLGDSYVFGWGVQEDERMGAVLERLLAGSGVRAECLHLGVVSWNAVAECAFLRRQLATLAPDLVVQVMVENDLEDCAGVRGFGVLASFSPHVYRHANGTVSGRTRLSDGKIDSPLENPLLDGLDGESRGRYDDAGARLRELADDVERAGGRDLLLAMWDEGPDVLRQHVFEQVGEARCAFLPHELSERGMWLTPSDDHWKPEGHALVARLVHALVRERDLLPGHALPARPGDDELLASIAAQMRRAADPATARAREAALSIAFEVSFGPTAPATAAQVYAGLEDGGEAAPYASLVLLNLGGAVLVAGEPLGRDELRGRHATVLVDEVPLGTIDLSPGPPFQLHLQLPPELARRPWIAVRFEAEDWVYRDLPTTHGISFRLKRVQSTSRE